MPKLTKSDQTERLSMYVTPCVLELIDASARKNRRSRAQELNCVVELFYLAQETKKELLETAPSER